MDVNHAMSFVKWLLDNDDDDDVGESRLVLAAALLVAASGLAWRGPYSSIKRRADLGVAATARTPAAARTKNAWQSCAGLTLYVRKCSRLCSKASWVMLCRWFFTSKVE